MNKQIILFAICLFISSISLKGSSENQFAVSWAKSIKGDYELYSPSITTAENKAFYISGSFEGNMIINNDTIRSEGGRDGFAGKIDSAGQWKWFVVIESDYYCHINTVAENYNNKTYFTGSFKGTIEHNGLALTNQQNLSVFIGCINDTGNLMWITDLGINSLGSNHHMETTPDNSIYFATTFIDDIQVGDSIINASKNRQILISKLSYEGQIQKFTTINSPNSLNLNGFKTINKNKFLVGGSFSDKVHFDGHVFYSKGTEDVFIMQIDSTFNLKKTNIIEGRGVKKLHGIKAANNEKYFAYGEFMGEMNLGGNLYNPERMKGLYIAQFNNEGNNQWTHTISGKAGVNINNISLNQNNETYVLFNYRGELYFNDEIFKADSLIFENMLAKILHDGSVDWVKHAKNKSPANIKTAPESIYGSIKATAINRADTLYLWNEMIIKENSHFYYMELFDCGYTIPPEPLNDTSICAGDLVDGGEDFKEYLWNESYVGRFFEPDTSGYYSLTRTDNNGCIFHDTLYVEVLPGITAEIKGKPDFCPETTTVLDAGIAEEYLWCNGSQDRYIHVGETGEYSVTVTNQYQCTDSASMFVYQLEVPPIQIDDEITLMPGEEIILYPGEFKEYFWCNGSTNPTLTINADSLNTGTFEYGIMVTDFNECEQHKDFTVTVEDATFTDEEHSVSNFCNLKLYPNPAKDIINLEYNCSGDECVAQIIVFDIHGRPVYNDEIIEKEQIQLIGLKPGKYFVRIFNSQDSCSVKTFYIVK